MDSQLAIAQISNSLDDQNVSQSLDESGPKVFVGPKDKTLPSTLPGNFQLFPITAVSSRHAFSINREMSALGATSKPGLKTCKSDGLRQPITVKTSMPVLNNQPIRIKIVVPQRCKKPITNNTTSLTKELLPSQFTRSTHVPTVSITGKNTCKIPPTPSPLAIMYEQETEEVIDQKIETPKAGPLCEMGMDGKKESDKEDDNANEQNDRANINPTTASEPPLVASSETAQARKPTEKRAVSRNENAFPPNLQEVDLKVTESVGLEVGVHGEQTEPLDLSLPKKRESNERRYGHLWEDSCCESSLIMEVDEFEGDGDRDVVEEDDNGGTEEGGRVFHASGVDTFGESILSPSFFSTSVLTALSSIDSDNEKLLFIDDQGIPYNLSPEGHKVPQIDTSKIEDPPSGHSLMRTNSVEAKRKGVSQSVSLMGSNLSQSLDDPAETLSAPRDNLASLASVADSQSQRVDPSKAAELSTSAPLTENHEPPKDPESCIPAANETGGVSASDQPVPILTNPSTSTSILLLSSPLSSSPLQCSPSPMGLSFPISVPQNQAASSAPMFLLLSSVPSSAGQPVAASTPIAVLDPSTGQLSQITGSSSQLSLPVSSGQVGKFGSSLLSYPVIQLSPNNTSVVLPGGGSHNLNTTSSSAPALQTPNLIPSVGAINNVAPIILTQTVFSDSNVETKVISTEENTKPSTFTPTRSASPLKTFDGTHDTLAHSSPQAADQSPRSEPEIDPPNPQLETVPLEDHLYFSSTRAPPPSPPIGPILPTSQLDSMDPLDPLSPASSPNSMGPRKVLYCQLCPRVFFYLSDLERHAITHSQKKPHICQQCGKAFKRSSHLQRHKHIHTGQRNYVCPICAKRFREAGELQRHQRVHTGEKPYQCQLCHTRFAERNTLRRHTKRKHPYHQVAMEMLNERRGGAGGPCAGGGGGGVQEEEESAEWYSSTVSTLENSESDMES